MIHRLILLAFFFLPKYSEPAAPVKNSGTFQVEFIHKAGHEVLAMNTPYITLAGEEISISRFKYYISHLRFGNGKLPETESCFLIDEEKPESKIITVKSPAGTYSRLSFLLGVDSLKNCSGAQAGALDPVNGMFWTWNTGYIMAKLEGQSPASSLPGHIFEYHIGGFKGENSVLKSITLELPEKVELKNNQTVIIKINTDVLRWFNGPALVSVARTPACTTPGTLAKQMAGNYAAMFTLDTIKE